MARFHVNGLKSIERKLNKLEHANHEPLMMQWAVTMHEDNRRGVLAGTDKDGMPLRPVTYRPKPGSAKVGNRKKDRGFKGLGPHPSGINGNLTSAEYRKLSGPPLAPRGSNSRVITNFFQEVGRSGGIWWVEGSWDDVFSAKDVPFLMAHFTGAGRLPVRDLRGIRPEGMAKVQRQLRAWIRKLLGRGAFDV